MSRRFDGAKLTRSSPRLTRPSVTAPSQVWPKIKSKLRETCCVNPYGERVGLRGARSGNTYRGSIGRGWYGHLMPLTNDNTRDRCFHYESPSLQRHSLFSTPMARKHSWCSLYALGSG